MKTLQTDLPGVLVIEPDVFADARGFFLETYNAARYRQAGVTPTFVQDNHSRSIRGTIRGLHYQLKRPQAKLLRVVVGAVFDVAVDLRRGSPTFGKWTSVILTAENKRQFFIPAGFGHGFCVTSEVAELEYKCSDVYAADDQCGVLWSDAALAIPWPTGTPILSAKDEAYLPLGGVRSDLPTFAPLT